MIGVREWGKSRVRDWVREWNERMAWVGVREWSVMGE